MWVFRADPVPRVVCITPDTMQITKRSAHKNGGYAPYRAQPPAEPLAPVAPGGYRPRVPYAPAPAAAAPRVAGHPVRVQYQHRMW